MFHSSFSTPQMYFAQSLSGYHLLGKWRSAVLTKQEHSPVIVWWYEE